MLEGNPGIAVDRRDRWSGTATKDAELGGASWKLIAGRSSLNSLVRWPISQRRHLSFLFRCDHRLHQGRPETVHPIHLLPICQPKSARDFQRQQQKEVHPPFSPHPRSPENHPSRTSSPPKPRLGHHNPPRTIHHPTGRSPRHSRP